MSHLFLTALTILLTASCSYAETMHVQRNFELHGHRGCRGLIPENTIASMLKAIDLGVDVLEMDVVISADNKVVLSHEPFFSAAISSHPDGQPVQISQERELNLYKMSYEEIRRFDVGKRGNLLFPSQLQLPSSKPLLTNLLREVESYQKGRRQTPLIYNIEIKSTIDGDGVNHPPVDRYVDLVTSAIKDQLVIDRTIVQSFDVRPLKYLRQVEPRIKVSLLVDKGDSRSVQELFGELGAQPDIFSPHYSLVNKEVVRICHSLGVRVIPWTVNDLPLARTLVEAGVDGIITDYPDLIGGIRTKKLSITAP